MLAIHHEAARRPIGHAPSMRYSADMMTKSPVIFLPAANMALCGNQEERISALTPAAAERAVFCASGTASEY